MNRPPVRLGPLAVLFTVIAIFMTTLCVLTFTTAKADMALAERFAQTVRTRYALEKEGAELLRDGQTSFTLEKDGYVLTVESGGSGRQGEWNIHKIWDYDRLEDELWDGD